MNLIFVHCFIYLLKENTPLYSATSNLTLLLNSFLEPNLLLLRPFQQPIMWFSIQIHPLLSHQNSATTSFSPPTLNECLMSPQHQVYIGYWVSDERYLCKC